MDQANLNIYAYSDKELTLPYREWVYRDNELVLWRVDIFICLSRVLHCFVKIPSHNVHKRRMLWVCSHLNAAHRGTHNNGTISSIRNGCHSTHQADAKKDSYGYLFSIMKDQERPCEAGAGSDSSGVFHPREHPVEYVTWVAKRIPIRKATQKRLSWRNTTRGSGHERKSTSFEENTI